MENKNMNKEYFVGYKCEYRIATHATSVIYRSIIVDAESGKEAWEKVKKSVMDKEKVNDCWLIDIHTIN